MLSRASVAAGCLSRQVGHLSLACLLGRKVRLLSCLNGCALIGNLKLLTLRSIIQRLDSQRARKITSERWRQRRCAGNNRRVHDALLNFSRHIKSSPRLPCLKRGRTQWIDRQRIEHRSHTCDRLRIDTRDDCRIDDPREFSCRHDHDCSGRADIDQSINNHVRRRGVNRLPIRIVVSRDVRVARTQSHPRST